MRSECLSIAVKAVIANAKQYCGDASEEELIFGNTGDTVAI